MTYDTRFLQDLGIEADISPECPIVRIEDGNAILPVDELMRLMRDNDTLCAMLDAAERRARASWCSYFVQVYLLLVAVAVWGAFWMWVRP